MKTFDLNGNTYLNRIEGSENFYYALDIPHGDLYEAYELYQLQKHTEGSLLYVIDAKTEELFIPFERRANTYHSNPVFTDGKIDVLSVDFRQESADLYEVDPKTKSVTIRLHYNLRDIVTTYNLMLHGVDLTLSSEKDDILSVYYPVRRDIALTPHESFFFREGRTLYFADWWEDEEDNYRYYERTILRDLYSGVVINVMEGDIFFLPDGRRWHVK